MKKFVLPVLLLGLINIVSCDQNEDRNIDYDKFEKRYRKSSKQKQQKKDKRRKIFKKNYQKFLIQSADNPSLGVNKFMDWTEEQIKAFFNLKQQQQVQNRIIRSQTSNGPAKVESTTLPKIFNYVDLQKLPPIRDQGQCGSCWSFASIAVYQARYMLQNGIMSDLSQQYLLDCLIPDVSLRCDGGYSSKGLKLLNETGSPYQIQYPYNQYYNWIAQDAGYVSQGMCNTTTNYVRLPSTPTTIYYTKTMTDSQLISELVNHGPMVVSVKGDHPSFQGLSNAPYQVNNCYSTETTNHAVVLVGYTSTHYLIRNSWNTTWGDKGYGYISRTNDCGIKSNAYVFRTGMNYSSYPKSNIKLNISMSDSALNGWGFTLGLRQNGVILANFTLTTTSPKIVQVAIDSRTMTDIVIVSSSSARSLQIGFKIILPITNTIIFTRATGKSFSSTLVGTKIGSFCPSYCPPLPGTIGATANDQQTDYTQQSYVGESPINQQHFASGLSKLQVIMICISSAMFVMVVFLALITCYFYKLSAINRRRRKNFQSTSHETGKTTVASVVFAGQEKVLG